MVNGSMHPRLLLVARHGDYERLMDLLSGAVMPPEVIVAFPERVLQVSIDAVSEGDHYLIEADDVHNQMSNGQAVEGGSLTQVNRNPIDAATEGTQQSAPFAAEFPVDLSLSEVIEAGSRNSDELAVEGSSLMQQDNEDSITATAERADQFGSLTDLLLQGVTFEGDTALHVVATSGDNEKFMESAKVIYNKAKHLLHAPNKMGDTPLHCAARAGNDQMVSCLVSLAKGEDGGEERLKKLIRRKNKLGETALHEAIRSANRNIIDELMSEDPDLASIPNKGTSPLYLAISLGRINIVQLLCHRTAMRLSYSGPDEQNVLHVAVFRGEGI